jgi:V8-like Glu-specific endopeptidase
LLKLFCSAALSVLSLTCQLIQPLAAAVFDRQGTVLSEINLDPARVNWQLLNSQDHRIFNGVGLIKIRDFSSCTGFFIQSAARSANTPAYVLTNAHCIDLIENLLSPTEIVVNQQLRSYGRNPPILSYTPNYFKGDRNRSTYIVKKILYATMKNSDVALLELNISQRELMLQGISPLALANHPASTGAKIEVIGIPGEAIPASEQFIYRSTCPLGPTVRLKEGGYEWRKALRHRCSLLGGMSGSPMISGGKVVGIVNTGGGTGGRRSPLCTLDNPCEIGAGGRRQPTTSSNYGQLVHQLTDCFDQGIFNLNRSGCQLEKP